VYATNWLEERLRIRAQRWKERQLQLRGGWDGDVDADELPGIDEVSGLKEEDEFVQVDDEIPADADADSFYPTDEQIAEANKVDSKDFCQYQPEYFEDQGAFDFSDCFFSAFMLGASVVVILMVAIFLTALVLAVAWFAFLVLFFLYTCFVSLYC